MDQRMCSKDVERTCRSRKQACIAVLATLLCASAGTWLWAGPAYASFPGKNGALALDVFDPEDSPSTCGPEEVSCAFGGSRIAIFDRANRTTRVLLTCARTPCSDTNPNWSPDGRRLVYARAPLNTLGIVNADGTGVRTLTGGRIGAWSPDGRRLVVEDLPDSRSRRQLYVINADGTGRRQLTIAGGLEPAWSSSNRIVFTRYDKRSRRAQLRVIRPGGGRSRLVARSGETADWSPHGSRLVFRSHHTRHADGIYVALADGSQMRRITSQGEEPVWSPDGRQIAFTRRGALLSVSSSAPRSRARLLRRGDASLPAWQPLP